jgi:hypothetical protein
MRQYYVLPTPRGAAFDYEPLAVWKCEYCKSKEIRYFVPKRLSPKVEREKLREHYAKNYR